MSGAGGDRRDLATLPKAELHLHLEGSMRPSTLAELADAAAIPVPAIRGYGSFTTFAETYHAACEVMRGYDDVLRLVREVAQDRQAAGAVWIEPSFYLPLHEGRLGSPAEVLEMLTRAAAEVEQELGIGIGFMPAGDRTLDPAIAVEQARLAASHAGRGVVAFGLSNDEAIGPLEHYAEAFAVARDAGLLSTPHAGELAGPDQVAFALEVLAADRIEHGVRAVEDPELMRRLADAGTCLDVCLTSNVMLSVVDDITDHPLPTLLAAGIRCTINTDDSLLFGPGLLDEYELARDTFGLDDVALAAIARTSIEASGAPDARKREASAAIDDWLATPPPS
jgi:adenosine deaminase